MATITVTSKKTGRKIEKFCRYSVKEQHLETELNQLVQNLLHEEGLDLDDVEVETDSILELRTRSKTLQIVVDMSSQVKTLLANLCSRF